MEYTSANVHPKAKIAENVIIEPFATVHEDVIIGKGCKIGANAVIMNGAILGENVTVFPGAVIAGIPQDLKFKGEKTTAEIGDNTVIREYVTINRGTAAKNKTIVGKNCLLMAYVHIGHDCIVGNNVIMSNSATLAGEVEVDDFAILGGSTKVHQFTKIGKYAFTQGGLLLGKDIPPFVKSARYPASYAGINSVGMKRHGFSHEVINMIQDIYRIIFNSGLNFTNALNKVIDEIPDCDEKTIITDFIKNSKRGLIQGFNK